MTVGFSLVVITDWGLGAERLLAQLGRALTVPGLAVQHRHPGAADGVFFDEVRQLASLCARAKAPLFVNGRLDVALAVGAHLHCTSTSLRPSQVRPHLRGGLVSCGVHDGEDADGADLALVSPVFAPGSKPLDPRPTLGAAGYARLAAGLPCPAFALGGVTPENAKTLAAPGLATITGVLHAADPAAAARALLTATRR